VYSDHATTGFATKPPAIAATPAAPTPESASVCCAFTSETLATLRLDFEIANGENQDANATALGRFNGEARAVNDMDTAMVAIAYQCVQTLSSDELFILAHLLPFCDLQSFFDEIGYEGESRHLAAAMGRVLEAPVTV
jgi:hypothetical protein